MNRRGNDGVLLPAMCRGPCLLRDAPVRRCCNRPLPDLSGLSAADAHHEWSLPDGSSPLGAARRRRKEHQRAKQVRHPAVRQPHDWEAEEVEAVQVRPRRQDAPAHGRPAPDVPDVGPVAHSLTEVLSVLAGTRCPDDGPRPGLFAPLVRVALDQPERRLHHDPDRGAEDLLHSRPPPLTDVLLPTFLTSARWRTA